MLSSVLLSCCCRAGIVSVVSNICAAGLWTSSNLPAVDNSSLETCRDLNDMLNAETFYLTVQNVKGCALPSAPASNSRSVVSFLAVQ